MNSSRGLSRFLIAGFATFVVASLVGCGSQQFNETEVFTISVTLAGKPLDDVRVALVAEDDRSGPVLFEGVSAQGGQAGMVALESDRGDVNEFAVICESLGDWQIIPPWSNAEKTPLTLQWQGEETLNIELPRKAVRAF